MKNEKPCCCRHVHGTHCRPPPGVNRPGWSDGSHVQHNRKTSVCLSRNFDTVTFKTRSGPTFFDALQGSNSGEDRISRYSIYRCQKKNPQNYFFPKKFFQKTHADVLELRSLTLAPLLLRNAQQSVFCCDRVYMVGAKLSRNCAERCTCKCATWAVTATNFYEIN